MLRLDTKTRELAARARFGFNAVGGYSAQTMLRLLQPNASSVMVTYGGMSKQPLVVPTGASYSKTSPSAVSGSPAGSSATNAPLKAKVVATCSTASPPPFATASSASRRRRDVPRQPSRRASPRRHGGRRRPHHPHPRSQKFSFVSTARRASSFPLDSPRRARRAWPSDRLAHCLPTRQRPPPLPGMAHLGPRPTRRPSSHLVARTSHSRTSVRIRARTNESASVTAPTSSPKSSARVHAS